jgi:hypothetical protein
MARKSKARVMTDGEILREKITDFRSLNWVLNNLSDTEISAMDATNFDPERFAEFIEKLVDNGFDVKLTWDTYSNTYQISAMGAWQNFPNENFAVSARGMDMFDAWKVLWFKVDFIAQWDLSQFLDKSPSRKKRG